MFRLDFSKNLWLYGGEESVPCVSCASSSAAVATRNALGVVFPSAGHEHFRGRQGVLTPFLPSKHVVLELVGIPYFACWQLALCAVPSALRVCHTVAQHWRLACASPIIFRVLDHDVF